MGQKVNPNGMRLGIIRDWDSRWYAKKTDVPTLLNEDLRIRKEIETYYASAQVSKVIIERPRNSVAIYIYTAKPGAVIGKEGAIKNTLVDKLTKMTDKKVVIRVMEIKNPDLDATLVARRIAEGIENRTSFRRVQKKAIQQTMKSGAKGIKTLVSGRLGGAEMARAEGYSEGTVPLHTLRADIDYALAEANTTYGKLGVKVWICKGEILPAKKEAK
ncbi:MAG: 30S ribosomal protein S3 [Bacilli bacterium]